jgi:hypothetical protein
MVDFPPVPVSFPRFPPLPVEIKPVVTNPPPVIVAPAPPPPAPSLFIVGTQVATNEASMTNSVPAPADAVPGVTPKATLSLIVDNSKTTPPVVVGGPVPAVAPNTTPAIVTPPTPVPAVVETPVPATNQPVAAAAPDDHLEVGLICGGIGLLVVAAGLIIFLLGRNSAPRGSLITSSMQDKSRSKDQ